MEIFVHTMLAHPALCHSLCEKSCTRGGLRVVSREWWQLVSVLLLCHGQGHHLLPGQGLSAQSNEKGPLFQPYITAKATDLKNNQGGVTSKATKVVFEVWVNNKQKTKNETRTAHVNQSSKPN